MNLLYPVKALLYRLRGDCTTEQLQKMGLTVGKNFKRMKGTILDPSHCWLIEIGDNVTLAPNVHILCHDASTKTFLDYTRIARVTIGDNVFIGAGTVVLPGVTIGSNAVIGANSTVTHSVPSGTVYAGSPAREICSLEDYLNKEKSRMEEVPVYEENYTLPHITDEMKQEQKAALADTEGFVR